ncbi:MAG: hypothetical protein R3240_02480 [Gammaproteobacteria bacterium]|nr:hypothetical protein [Gammaproteobacteria bacterium]
MDSLAPQLFELLLNNARHASVISYRDAAAELGITSSPIIAQISQLLEAQMQADQQQGRPQFAALVVQKKGDVPRPGFFEKLQVLHISHEVLSGEAAKQWHAQELIKIHNWIQDNDS